MILVDTALQAREAAGKPIRVGIIGAGFMARGLTNQIVNSVAGSLASSPFPREPWLLAVTCEDRKVVRKCCIRVLLVRREDLDRLASWDWCRDHILVDVWYHFWRIVTLHQTLERASITTLPMTAALGAT